jgi:hypothetical protein
MSVDWFWQGLLTNWVFYILVGGSGGVMIWAKIKQHPWSSPVLYGLCTSALMALTLYTMSAQHEFATEKAAQTNSDNVMQKASDWLDSFRLRVRNAPLMDLIFSTSSL